jgi:hypothetical protein
VAVTSANEVDEIAALAAAATRRTLVVARRTAEARRQTQARQRATASAATPAAAHAREDAALAAAWRREAIAARWAAADVLRAHDPQTAAAWDERVHAAGIDPDTVRSEATTSTGITTSTDPDAAASDVVTEHLAGVYTDEAVTAAPATTPTDAPAASVADLIAATHCETPERGHSAAFDPTPATTADVERLEHTRGEGVER